jgi:hypothetical protein
METELKCSSYHFAFNLKLLIRLNINCGFEYKKGYISFGLKGLSCGFSTAYFHKVSGEMFCEKNFITKSFTNTIQVQQIATTFKFPSQSCIYF